MIFVKFVHYQVFVMVLPVNNHIAIPNLESLNDVPKVVDEILHMITDIHGTADQRKLILRENNKENTEAALKRMFGERRNLRTAANEFPRWLRRPDNVESSIRYADDPPTVEPGRQF